MDTQNNSDISKDPVMEHKHRLPIDEREFQGKFQLKGS